MNEMLEMIRQGTMGWRRGLWRPRMQQHRVEILEAVLRDHPEARIECCASERTGVRYGERKCRVGRCRKLGHSSFDGAGSGYQVWVVWPAAETK